MLKQFGIVLFLAAALRAEDPASLQQRGYVNDFAGVLSAEATQEINRYLRRVDEGTKAQIAIVTVQTLDGAPVEDFSIELARRWGVGYKNKGGAPTAQAQTDQGVLVLFAIRDRKMRIETGYGVEDAIPDGFAGDLLRGARPALRTGDYNAAFAQMAHTLGERIAAKRGVSIPDRIPQSRRVRDDASEIPWPLIVVAIVLVLWFIGRSRGGRGGGFRRYGGGPGVIWMPPFGGGGYGGGSSSSGGFGGYDSSDSFGGFGGGDFGGGGASSDW